MIDWIWRQIGVSLPPDWEMLQFSRESKRGRCAFADRRRFRFELNWHAFAAEPDFDRMMTDYASTLDANWHDIQSLRCAGWPGLTGRREHEIVSRFGRYFPLIGVLVEAVVIHPETRDSELESRILGSIRPVPVDPEGYQRWRTFGMDLKVPASFSFAESQVQPARCGLLFQSDKGPDRWIFRRYGMLKSWLKTPLREWLESQTDPAVRYRRLESGLIHTIPVERVHGEWRPRGLLLKKGLYAASAWIDPRDQRLYHVQCITSKSNHAFHPRERAEKIMASCPEFFSLPKPSIGK
ncbi:MAG TPA: hypothetical protein PKE55_00680 [Kiritimatiellia bacterium]|nr:hypothetical protein [Kiritimatiellia bacterium]